MFKIINKRINQDRKRCKSGIVSIRGPNWVPSDSFIHNTEEDWTRELIKRNKEIRSFAISMEIAAERKRLKDVIMTDLRCLECCHDNLENATSCSKCGFTLGFYKLCNSNECCSMNHAAANICPECKITLFDSDEMNEIDAAEKAVLAATLDIARAIVENDYDGNDPRYKT